MDNNFENSVNTNPPVSSRLVAGPILATVMLSGIFLGAFAVLGLGADDEVSKASMVTKTGTTVTAADNPTTIIDAKVKTWYFDTGRLIFPVIDIFAVQPTTDAQYKSMCAAVSDRLAPLKTVPAAPAADTDKSFTKWIATLEQIVANCDLSHKLVDDAVATSGRTFSEFHDTLVGHNHAEILEGTIVPETAAGAAAPSATSTTNPAVATTVKP